MKTRKPRALATTTRKVHAPHSRTSAAMPPRPLNVSLSSQIEISSSSAMKRSASNPSLTGARAGQFAEGELVSDRNGSITEKKNPGFGSLGLQSDGKYRLAATAAAVDQQRAGNQSDRIPGTRRIDFRNSCSQSSAHSHQHEQRPGQLLKVHGCLFLVERFGKSVNEYDGSGEVRQQCGSRTYNKLLPAAATVNQQGACDERESVAACRRVDFRDAAPESTNSRARHEQKSPGNFLYLHRLS